MPSMLVTSSGPASSRRARRWASQAATKVGAEALGIEAEAGQIAAGYSADIVAVTRDPLADIHALDAVEFVMKQGTVYKQ